MAGYWLRMLKGATGDYETDDDGNLLLELPEAHGAAAWAKQEGIAKAGTGAPRPGAKYVKRVATGIASRPWRYYYTVQAKGGIGAHEHMVEGARFKHGEGHHEITKVHANGDVTVRHTHTGEERRMSKADLGRELEAHHAKAIAAHKERMAESASVRRLTTPEAKEAKRGELAAERAEAEKYAERGKATHRSSKWLNVPDPTEGRGRHVTPSTDKQREFEAREELAHAVNDVRAATQMHESAKRDLARAHELEARGHDAGLADWQGAVAERGKFRDRANARHAAAEEALTAAKAASNAMHAAADSPGRFTGSGRDPKTMTKDEIRDELSALDRTKNPVGHGLKLVREKPLSVGQPEKMAAIVARETELREAIGTLPWQRTKDEVKRVMGMPEHRHRRAVKEALEAGKSVPAHVLAGHPGVADDARAALTGGAPKPTPAPSEPERARSAHTPETDEWRMEDIEAPDVGRAPGGDVWATMRTPMGDSADISFSTETTKSQVSDRIARIMGRSETKHPVAREAYRRGIHAALTERNRRFGPMISSGMGTERLDPDAMLAPFAKGTIAKATPATYPSGRPRLTDDEAVELFTEGLRAYCDGCASGHCLDYRANAKPFASPAAIVVHVVRDLADKAQFDPTTVQAIRELGGFDAVRSLVRACAESAWAEHHAEGSPLPRGVLELPAGYGEAAYNALHALPAAAIIVAKGWLEKGASHRYIKRTATGNPRRPWRYTYTVQGHGGVDNHEHMVEGARFRHGNGHYEIKRVDGDTVHLKHDETGHETSMTKAQLGEHLRAEHAAAIREHRGKTEARAARRVESKPAPKAEPSPHGAHTTIYTHGATGTPEATKARYVLRESEDVTPSHDHDTFKPHARYPEGVQERQYHRSEHEKAKVLRNADTFAPALALGPAATAMEGAPIVTADGVVLGGNSRTMTMQHLYATGRGDKVRGYLAEKAQEFGIDPKAVAAMKAPILVRQLDDVHSASASPEQLRTLVRKYNVSAANELDPRAEQVALAHQIGEGTLAALDDMHPDESLNDFLTSSRSRGFVDSLYRANVLTQKNADRYTVRGQQKKLNEDGRTLASRLLVGKMVPDADLLSELPASTMQNLARNAPSILAAKARGHDITPELHTALKAEVDRVNGEHRTIDDLTRQVDFVRGEHPIASDTKAKLLHGVVTGAPLQGQRTLRGFAEWAARNPKGQASMFGTEDTHAALARIANDESKPKARPQADLFASLRQPLADLLKGSILLGKATPPKPGYPKQRAEYADPKGMKYPLDTPEHVRAALAYFGDADNRAAYSEAEQRAIYRRIFAAAKRHGVTVSADVKAKAGVAKGGYWLEVLRCA